MVNEFSTDNTYREAYKKQQEEIINLLKGANIPAISDPVLQKDLVQKQNEFLSQYGWGVDETGQTYYKGGGNIDGPKPLDPKLGSSRQATPQELGNFGQSATLPPTFSEQMALAQKMGITNYTGTPEQKAQLQKGTTTGTTPTQMGTQTGTPTQQFSLTSGNLQQGSKDVNVGQLQSILNQLGGYGLKEDNIFGPKTREAVMAFQKANGLVADGIVGPKTLAKINELQAQKTQKEDVVKGAVDETLTNSGVDTSTLENKFATNPTGAIQDIVKQISDSSGISKLNDQITKLIEEQKSLADKKNQEATDIANNPWISEGLKQRKLDNLNKKYQQQEENILNSLQLYQNQLTNAEEMVRYTTTQAINQYNVNREYDATQAQNAIENALAMTKLESGIVGEYQYAVQNGYTGTFTQYQNEDANRKASIAKAGASTTILPTTQDLTTKETSEALGTVNSIGNILTNANFNTTFGVTGLVKYKIPGTPEYTLASQIQQVKDKLSLAARGQLKGQGQVSNFEGLMLANAQTALKFGMKPEDARQELINIAGALTTSTGGKAKVQLKDKSGAIYTIMSDSRGITKAIADGLSVKYVE